MAKCKDCGADLPEWLQDHEPYECIEELRRRLWIADERLKRIRQAFTYEPKLKYNVRSWKDA